MLDTHAVARSLTAADFTPAQADALTDALRSAVEHGDHVTSDQFKAGQAELRAEIANLDTLLSTQISEVRTEIAELVEARDRSEARTARAVPEDEAAMSKTDSQKLDLEKLLQDGYAKYAAVTKDKFGSPMTQLAPVRRFCDFLLNGTVPHPQHSVPGPPKKLRR